MLKLLPALFVLALVLGAIALTHTEAGSAYAERHHQMPGSGGAPWR